MHIVFESNDPEAIELRPLAERRVRLALRRLTWLAPRARISLSDINGPRGGTDKRCQVELSTDSTGPVIVTSIASNWRVALHSALARAAQALLRSWQRKRLGQRQSLALA